MSSVHFYCQNLTGDVNFSIEEWNKAFDEVKDMSSEIQRLVLGDPPACEEQCFACMAIVGEQRKKTAHLTGKSEDSPARKFYLEWKAKGKPPHEMYKLKT